MRTLFVAVVAIAIAVVALVGDFVPSADAATGPIPLNCNRACLENLVDQYLAAVVAHDPKRLPLSKDEFLGSVSTATSSERWVIGVRGAPSVERLSQTLEQSPTRYPEKPQAGPFFANLGAFLMGLTYGLPGIRLGPGEPHEWACRPVVLPEGWRSIEIERAWVRMQPARIVARHGAERAAIELSGQRRRRAA